MLAAPFSPIPFAPGMRSDGSPRKAMKSNPSTVLGYSVRYLAAFFARELLGDKSVGAAFEGAGATADVKAGLIEIAPK